MARCNQVFFTSYPVLSGSNQSVLKICSGEHKLIRTCVHVSSDTLCLNREAAEKAGQFTEAALMGAMPMCVPNFKNVVMPAIVHALDEWKHDAIKSECGQAGMSTAYI